MPQLKHNLETQNSVLTNKIMWAQSDKDNDAWAYRNIFFDKQIMKH